MLRLQAIEITEGQEERKLKNSKPGRLSVVGVPEFLETKMVKLKRVYEEPSPDDGLRVLVDRLWPRGLSKARAAVDLWLKDIAPSAELRKWFGHDPAKWEEFKVRYRKELAGNDAALETLRQRAREGTITLLYGARNEAHNDAVVLKDMLEGCKR